MLCSLYAHILLFLSVVFTLFVALYTSDVRRFESSVGINPSRVCCRCHDSYPYCPSALWRLSALKIQVCTDFATRQIRNFCCISFVSPPDCTRTVDECHQLIPTNGYIVYEDNINYYTNDTNERRVAFIAFVFLSCSVEPRIMQFQTQRNHVLCHVCCQDQR